MIEVRPNSISVAGGAFGDEGKGRVVDEICNRLVKRFSEVIVYRWNGGSNAGHTVELQDKRLFSTRSRQALLSKTALVYWGAEW